MVLMAAAAAGLACASAAQFDARSFGAVGDGEIDDSRAFQTAIDEAFIAGGGEVFVPGSEAGYRLERPILIRPNVTLRGFHAGPADAHFLAEHDAGNPKPFVPVAGGVLIAQIEHPAVTLAHNSGIAGLTFAYPDQVPYAPMPIKPYPPLLQVRGFGPGEQVPGIHRDERIAVDGSISGRSVSIRDLGAINAYHILDMTGENPPAQQVAQITVDGLWGYPLSVGINIQNSLDTIFLRNVQLRPTFFHDACGEISKTSIGLSLGKTDGCAITDLLVFGLGIGVLHRCVDGSLEAFSVRVNNANVEAMLPVWFDSHAVDDQVQYANSFLFHTEFGFKRTGDDVYSREGHDLFPDIRFAPDDLCVVRVSNRREKPTFQSYARFVGCGFHAKNSGPVCRVEGDQVVRVMLASSHMVYFRDSVLDVAEGAKVLATITGNDIMCWGSPDLSVGRVDAEHAHLIDFSRADPSCNAIFSSNMIHGARPELVDELADMPKVVAEGNLLAQ